MECFDGNVLEYQYFMALFREVVESKTEDPRGRLTRLIKYRVGDDRDHNKHCIQIPSSEDFTQAKYLLEKMYGNPHRILASYRKEVNDWPQIKFGESRGFRKFHSFLLKCRSVEVNQRWNTLILPDILQGSTNLIFVCADFHARKMVLRASLCTQNYMYIKQ